MHNALASRIPMWLAHEGMAGCRFDTLNFYNGSDSLIFQRPREIIKIIYQSVPERYLGELSVKQRSISERDLGE